VWEGWGKRYQNLRLEDVVIDDDDALSVEAVQGYV
jgi:hypothetical protein